MQYYLAGKRKYARITLFVLALIAAVASVATSRPANAETWEISNPYETVDWEEYQRHKSNFHTHTTQSDGRMSPARVIDEYNKRDYTVLALADHNLVTWPWTAFDRDPEELGMVAVQGAEPSRHHHMGTYFCDVPGREDVEGTLADVREQEGLAVMFHPGRYNWEVEDYAKLYRAWDELIGMEIYNQGDRYPGDRDTWDAVLTELMPEGPPVWGFSNDDMHSMGHLGRNWNVLLLPELSADTVRESLEEGRFFYVYASAGHDGPAPPEIEAITVDRHEGTIRIEAVQYDSIEWVSGGRIIARGEKAELGRDSARAGYIRAVLRVNGEEGDVRMGTQPFGIMRQE